MIKIIKRGTKAVTTCDECGCEFSYEEEDINHTRDEEIIFGIPSVYTGRYVICPQCARGVMLASSATRDIT